jgi:Tfp pilus assembly PilM family ATPase
VELQAAYQRCVENISKRLARFDALRQEGRYVEASAQLQDIPRSDDTRLQPLFAEIDARSSDYSRERAARSEEVAGQFAQAQQALAGRDFAGALRLLQQIPVGFRDQAMTDALNVASDAVQEISALTQRVRDGLRSTAIDELLPYVHRLLELRPNDDAMIKLAEQLRQRQQQQGRECARQHLIVAKKHFLAGHYARAAEAVRAIAEEYIAPEQRRFYDTVQEVNGVIRWLEQEPFVHRALVSLTQRWLRLRPQDATAAETAARLRERLARPEDRRFASTWNDMPHSTDVGCTVKWWRGLEDIDVGVDGVSFRQSFPRFAVAFGLALQGLGLGTLPLNLLRQRQRAMWQKLSSFRASSPPRVVWGCDLSSTGLKALELRRDHDTDQLQIIDAVFVPHACPLTEADDDDATAEILQATMATFVEKRRVSDRVPLVLGCAGPRSLGRTFEIPQFQGKKAQDAIAYEAKRQIPIPADEIAFDWHAWPIRRAGSRLQSVTLLAARRDHIQQIVDACANLPVKLLAIQSDCLALYNAAAAQFFAPPTESQDGKDTANSGSSPTIAILDVGADCSSLVIAAAHFVRHRSFPWGMHRLDRTLMSQFNLTAQQAQQLRQQPSSARWIYQLADVIDNVFEELAQDVSRTLRAYEAEGICVDQLLVTGGGSQQLGLFRRLVGVHSFAREGTQHKVQAP